MLKHQVVKEKQKKKQIKGNKTLVKRKLKVKQVYIVPGVTARTKKKKKKKKEKRKKKERIAKPREASKQEATEGCVARLERQEGAGKAVEASTASKRERNKDKDKVVVVLILLMFFVFII